MDSKKMLTFFIVIAIILTITGFLLVQFITQEPEMPAVTAPTPAGDQNAQIVEVDGTFVTLQRNPNRAVVLAPSAPAGQQSESGTGQAEGPGDPGPTPTATTPPPTPVPPTATSPPTPQVPNHNVEKVIFVQHNVGPNDTLYSISNQYKTSIELMAEKGKGIDIEDIFAGNTIDVPIPNPDYCPGIVAYAVRGNDTVFSLAQKYNTTPQEIARINSLDANYRIDINQILCIQ